MPISERRDRDRAQRHKLILRAAREIAEKEGWAAVTTRRLAERVEYSQPVLYSHFENRDAIVRAVMIEGFAELSACLNAARVAAKSGARALQALMEAYLEFAETRPALYLAMFVLPTAVKFASAETPPSLRAAFAEFVAVLRTFDPHPDLRAEILWSALHGMVVLTQAHRIPAEGRQARLDLLAAQIVANAGEK
jgi:AcrR family transcriptional regulator